MTHISLRTTPPQIRWNEAGLPASTQFNDVFFSDADPLAESTHVFIQGSNLTRRWQQTAETGCCFCIAELGFGTGLNFLNTWYHWEKLTNKHSSQQRLHYIGLEQFPLCARDMAKIHRLWPALKSYSTTLLKIYDDKSAGWHRFDISDSICLDLYFGEAERELAVRSHSDQAVDAWFIDGFSPDRNESLCSQSVFKLMATHSHSNSTVTTYSSAGKVRRGLEAAGFKVSRRTGFGRKRHMLIAEDLIQDIGKRSFENQSPWFQYPARSASDSSNNNKDTSKQAIVIGAGLAGANAAFALARRNYQVTVIEKARNFGAGASGIPQLALHCRLFRHAKAEAQFYLQAYLYAIRSYSSLKSVNRSFWHEVGMVQQADAMNKSNKLSLPDIEKNYADNIVTGVTPELQAAMPHLTIDDEALWFPHSGWINSSDLCQALLNSPRISVKLDRCVTQIGQENGLWGVTDKDRELVAKAPVLIGATGSELRNLSQFQSLPLELRVGQSTQCESYSREFSESIKPVVSGVRSIFPPQDEVHTISASYRELSSGLSPQPEDDEINLKKIAVMFGISEKTQLNRSFSHARVRANSEDRLPIVGQVPVFGAMEKQYKDLARNARQKFHEPGQYYDGLYVSAAHGSTGVATTALAGEYLAALISGESLPVNKEIKDLLNPSRFLIRNLKRQRQ